MHWRGALRRRIGKSVARLRAHNLSRPFLVGLFHVFVVIFCQAKGFVYNLAW